MNPLDRRPGQHVAKRFASSNGGAGVGMDRKVVLRDELLTRAVSYLKKIDKPSAQQLTKEIYSCINNPIKIRTPTPVVCDLRGIWDRMTGHMSDEQKAQAADQDLSVTVLFNDVKTLRNTIHVLRDVVLGLDPSFPFLKQPPTE